jgi:hypothetical protein
MERYEEDSNQAEPLTRLHRLAALSHDQHTDNYGYSDGSNPVPTIQPTSEGALDSLGPEQHDQLIENGGSYGHAG